MLSLQGYSVGFLVGRRRLSCYRTVKMAVTFYCRLVLCQSAEIHLGEIALRPSGKLEALLEVLLFRMVAA